MKNKKSETDGRIWQSLVKSVHTPTPWRVDRIDDRKMIMSAERGWVATMVDLHIDDENAAFIVKAVNCHEQMYIALQYAQNHLEKLEGEGVNVNQNVMKMIRDARRLEEV